MVELQSGQLVCSRAGRDKGKHYLVLKEIDEKYVLLVDGRSRPLARPKKKNKAHLQRYERRASLDKRGTADQLTDSHVIAALKELVPATGFPKEEV